MADDTRCYDVLEEIAETSNKQNRNLSIKRLVELTRNRSMFWLGKHSVIAADICIVTDYKTNHTSRRPFRLMCVGLKTNASADNYCYSGFGGPAPLDEDW